MTTAGGAGHGPIRRWRLLAAATAVVVSGAGCGGTGTLKGFSPFAGCWRGPTSSGAAVPAPTPPEVAVTDDLPFRPGADGLGDSYYPTAGNGGYDVADYHLDLRYDPPTRELTGVATITAAATQNLTSFNLDFTGLETTSITVNGAEAPAEQRGAELVVTPATRLAAGTAFTVVVEYEGEPRGYADPERAGTGFLSSAEGAIAMGEPHVAATWFPVNDHPRDKATYTIRLSVPERLCALANGVLVSTEAADRPGYASWTWRVTSPMAPYLATMVIGTYRVSQSTHRGRPLVLAVHTSLPARVDDKLARTPEVVDYLETVFGPYPFDALGGIVINEPRVSFALENQTRPIYSADFFADRDPSWVIAHELAHQWFGDSVSVHDWSEIWLNEGFATYAEWLWEEHDGGPSAQRTFDRFYSAADPSFWNTPPGAPGEPRLFSGAVYIRGGMTLHALRVTVGDEAFFRILREWPARKKDATATTPELIALAQEISGRDLGQLFQNWLYSATRPPRP